MDIKKIRDLLNSDIPEEMQEYYLKYLISGDERAIPDILDILAAERVRKKEILDDINVLLSKADIGLDEPEINKDGFMQAEIKAFYAKYKNQIGHCFKNYTKEDLKSKENEDFV